MRAWMLAAPLAALIWIAVAEEPPKANTSIGRLAWMRGAWTCEKWGGVFEEHWTAPAGDTLIGMGRLVVQGRTTFVEYLSVEPSPKDGAPVMFVVKGPASKVFERALPFRATKVEDSVAVFENAGNEWPKTITYAAGETDRLKVTLEGAVDGSNRVEEFAFQRMKE